MIKMDMYRRHLLDRDFCPRTFVVSFLLVYSCMVDHTVCQRWACPEAESTDAAIAEQVNVSKTTKNVTVLIDICLNKVRKIEDDITETVINCEWDGSESEFSRLRMSKANLTQSCQKVCSNMKQIRTCANSIRYSEYNAKRYDEFCMSYYDSISCKNRTLASGKCSIADSLFEQGMDDAIKRAFRYICNPGCPNITDAYNVLKTCFRDFNIDLEGSCSTFQRFQSCISLNSPCDEIWAMVPYFSTSYTDLSKKCPKLTSPRTTGAIVSTISQLYRSKAIDCLGTVKQKGIQNTTDKDICSTINCLIDVPVEIQQLQAIEKNTTILQTITERWTSCRNKSTEENRQIVKLLSTMTSMDQYTTSKTQTTISDTKETNPVTDTNFRQTSPAEIFEVNTGERQVSTESEEATKPQTSSAFMKTTKSEKLLETSSRTLAPPIMETTVGDMQELYTTPHSTVERKVPVLKPESKTTNSFKYFVTTRFRTQSYLSTKSKVLSQSTTRQTSRSRPMSSTTVTERSRSSSKSLQADAQSHSGGLRVSAPLPVMLMLTPVVWIFTFGE